MSRLRAYEVWIGLVVLIGLGLMGVVLYWGLEESWGKFGPFVRDYLGLLLTGAVIVATAFVWKLTEHRFRRHD